MNSVPGHELHGTRQVGKWPTGELVELVGVTTLDQWYSDFVETDWQYVERYYQTDQLPEWKSCVVSGCPLVTPAPIPELRHHEVQVRFAF